MPHGPSICIRLDAFVAHHAAWSLDLHGPQHTWGCGVHLAAIGGRRPPGASIGYNGSMKQPLPLTFVDRTDAEDVALDVAGAAGTTLEERARIMETLCRMAAELTTQQADPRRVLDWQDPLPDASQRLLARLRDQYRGR